MTSVRKMVYGCKYLEAVEAGEEMVYIEERSLKALLISSIPVHLFKSF